MKKLSVLIACVLVSACSKPIPEMLEGKTNAEKKEILLSECESEARYGHDGGKHHHYSHKPENKAHAENMIKICTALIQPKADKPTLLQQCRKEAGSGTYANKRLFKDHTDRLIEICDGFDEMKP